LRPWLAFVLAIFPALIAIALSSGRLNPSIIIVFGLIAFGSRSH